jgi:hypothetical protein
VWINFVEEKLKISILHNTNFLSKKNAQTSKNERKVIHIEKCGKYKKNPLINRVIHVIHIKKTKNMWFTYIFSKQMFCEFLIKMENVDMFLIKIVDFCDVKKQKNSC